MLAVDAVLLLVIADVFPEWLTVRGFADALLAALIIAAVGTALQVISGTNDDDEYGLRVTRRVARRLGAESRTDVPGIIYLEIDGLALPVLKRALRDGNAPTMARWVADDGYHLMEWETDLSSQTGASQAGILLGSNDNIPAFRWVEKATATMLTCSNAADCAEIERRHSTGIGLLADGGASRGNLLSGEADEAILTVSRLDEEKRANPGYRAFLANGFNVTRLLVLFVWELVLEWTAAARQKRRDVRPRGHRGGIYPFLRGAMCVFVRDLIVYSVLTDMMRGRPAVYATFASYDEVAHHSGLERADTVEALRKLDQQFGRIERARRFAPRPYEIVVLSDHGQTQGATFKQRHGYGLDELVERSLSQGQVAAYSGGDEQDAVVGHAVDEATGGKKSKPARNDVSGRDVVVLGSGNLGLIYLMDADRRLTLEEIDERHPKLIPALREHPHIGWLLVRSGSRGASALGPHGLRELASGQVEGEDPLAPFSPTAATHLLRTDGFAARGGHHGRQLLRPRARRGVRVRGADLLPRWPRRTADARVPAVSAVAAGSRRPDHRRRGRARGAQRLAPPPSGAHAGAGAGRGLAHRDRARDDRSATRARRRSPSGRRRRRAGRGCCAGRRRRARAPGRSRAPRRGPRSAIHRRRRSGASWSARRAPRAWWRSASLRGSSSRWPTRSVPGSGRSRRR